MAHKINITKLMDGPKQAIFHVYIENDGASGEIVDQVIVNPVTLVPTMKGVPSLTLEKTLHSFAGFDVKLEFESLVNDTPIWVLAERGENHTCFKGFSGLKDRSSALDGSGKLMFTTVGFTSAGDMGSFIIQVRKD